MFALGQPVDPVAGDLLEQTNDQDTVRVLDGSGPSLSLWMLVENDKIMFVHTCFWLVDHDDIWDVPQCEVAYLLDSLLGDVVQQNNDIFRVLTFFGPSCCVDLALFGSSLCAKLIQECPYTLVQVGLQWLGLPALPSGLCKVSWASTRSTQKCLYLSCALLVSESALQIQILFQSGLHQGRTWDSRERERDFPTSLANLSSPRTLSRLVPSGDGGSANLHSDMFCNSCELCYAGLNSLKIMFVSGMKVDG